MSYMHTGLDTPADDVENCSTVPQDGSHMTLDTLEGDASNSSDVTNDTSVGGDADEETGDKDGAVVDDTEDLPPPPPPAEDASNNETVR